MMSEISSIVGTVGKSNYYLLCRTENREQANTFLTELHLSDEMAALLHEIIERYRPEEDNPHLRILQAAHIEDDEYFSHMIQDDISVIIHDIRTA